MIKTFPLWNDLTWVAVNAPDEADLRALNQTYKVTPRYISYIKDRRERARFNYDADRQTGLLIFRAINRHDGDDSVIGEEETIPVAFLFKDKMVMTVVQKETKYVANLMTEIVKIHREA